MENKQNEKWLWQGQHLEHLTKEELIEAIKYCFNDITYLRQQLENKYNTIQNLMQDAIKLKEEK